MAEVRVELSQPLPEELSGELAKRIHFVSDAIDGFELVHSGDVVDAVVLTLGAGAQAGPADMAEKIQRVLVRDVLPQRVFPADVIWEAAVQRDLVDAYEELLVAGVVFEAGEGQVALGEPLVSLLGYLDGRLRAIALGLGNAREFLYPTLIPTHVLERFGYFGSFPQFVMFVTRLHNDIDVYNSFIEDFRAGGAITSELFSQCVNHDYCLPPTMCYHTYHQHHGRRLEGNCVVTARGKSFRFESKYHRGLERLWDFTIREIVFMGTPEFVRSSRERVMRETFALLEELEVGGKCEAANDPFFAGAETAAKIFSQRAMKVKYELMLDVAPDRRVAAASFNLHGPFFGEAFEIVGADSTAISTGCVGFGLERLVHAFLCQHGVDPANWPAAVRAGVG